jgi:CRISPR-associated endonuclease/helicase Cas3
MIISHPAKNGYQEKLLVDHLAEVASNAKEMIQKLSLNLNTTTKDNLASVAEKIGIMHDLGKASSYFQNYIHGGKQNHLTHHSFISAVITYVNFNSWEELSCFAPFAFKCVQKHHSNLSSFFNGGLDNAALINETLTIYQSVLDNINNDVGLTKLLQKHNISLPDLSYSHFQLLNDNLGDFSLTYSPANIDDTIESFLIQNLLFSVLIDADKHNAAGKEYICLEKLNPRLCYSPAKLIAEKNKKQGALNPLRNQFIANIQENLNIELSQKLYTLTAPTGSGKTFACLEFTNCIQKLEDTSRRVIYCLPYTSIIDQNYKEFESVLHSNLSEQATLDYRFIVKHHHLVDYSTVTKAEPTYNLDELQKDILSIESWESACVISTFVQLFHSLIGNRNGMIRKLHNIINSIILLDEVQNLPADYYPLLRVLFKVLAERFDTFILSCSATQPYLFPQDTYIELCEKELFSVPDFNRVKLNIDLKEQTLDEFCQNYLELGDSKSILIVMNTKRSALAIYDYLSSKFKSSYQVLCLTTLHIPLCRQKIIEKIGCIIKEEKTKVVLVSTQLIEAGVDISFQKVYRDFGPLDSIIQVAGRCNRHNELGELGGEMFLVNLQKDGKFLSHYVYDKYLLSKTKECLEGYTSLESRQFTDIVDNYYRVLDVGAKGRSLLEAISILNYDQNIQNQIPIADFKIITDNYATETLYILCDDTSTKAISSIISKLEYIKQNKLTKEELQKTKTALETEYRSLNSYQINISLNELNAIYDSYKVKKLNDHIYYIENEFVNDFYECTTGFKLYSTAKSSCLAF